MVWRIFIDGEAGTTGLEIRERLAPLPGVHLLSLPEARRKDEEARRDAMAEADLVILCLPDAEARRAVALAETLPHPPRLIDASTAHRVAEGWVYGFPELSPSQARAIAGAARVANPGCYATGAIALLHPLTAAGLLPPGQPLTIHAVSGYSCGGRAMIRAHEEEGGPAFELYALDLAHKHLPEIVRYAGLTRTPLFLPSVGHFYRGMLVTIPLFLDLLPAKPTVRDLIGVLEAHYREAPHVRVRPDRPARLAAMSAGRSDDLELYVFAREAEHQVLLVAALDNLGKGAAGAAVQNAALMLGFAGEESGREAAGDRRNGG